MSHLNTEALEVNTPVQNRFRTLQFKAKKGRAELEDYDLRIAYFI